MKMKLIICAAFLLQCFNMSAANNFYIVNANPWNQASNNTYMINVFGVAGWTAGNYSTTPSTIFAASTAFVFLEGSDTNAIALQQFISANQSLIENWVNTGGHLFINAAPTHGADINAGFGATVIHYPFNDSLAHGLDSSSPIFHCPYTPIGYLFSGHNVSNAYLTGTGLHTIIDNSSAYPTLAEKTWGSGKVVFGCLTDKSFWSPAAQAGNLFVNLVKYVADSVPCFTAVENVVAQTGNIEVYPNPANGKITITGTNIRSVSIVNTLGQVLLQQNCNSAKAVLNIGDVQVGLYFVVAKMASGETVTRKVLKE